MSPTNYSSERSASIHSDISMATDGQYYLSSNEESEYELESDEQVDEEDYGGASLDDVYQDMQNPQKVAWPNDAYQEFMKLICKH